MKLTFFLPVIDLMMNDAYVYFLSLNVNVNVISNDDVVVMIDVLHVTMSEI